MKIESQPNLDAPGAGLPALELFFAKQMFRNHRRKTSREQSVKIFEQERDQILQLVENLSEDVASKQVLIKRLRGLEDSSRFWSVYMVLDHLNIVNGQICHMIQALHKGKTPTREASTATVKPTSNDSETVEQFRSVCGEFLEKTAALDSLETSVKAPHPWFGPLDGLAWHKMLGFHMGLHRKQIEVILKNMG